MEKKTEKPVSESIPPTDFQPLKKPKTFIPEKDVEKKKYLDEFFSDEWKKNYFTKETPKSPVR